MLRSYISKFPAGQSETNRKSDLCLCFFSSLLALLNPAIVFFLFTFHVTIFLKSIHPLTAFGILPKSLFNRVIDQYLLSITIADELENPRW